MGTLTFVVCKLANGPVMTLLVGGIVKVDPVAGESKRYCLGCPEVLVTSKGNTNPPPVVLADGPVDRGAESMGPDPMVARHHTEGGNAGVRRHAEHDCGNVSTVREVGLRTAAVGSEVSGRHDTRDRCRAHSAARKLRVTAGDPGIENRHNGPCADCSCVRHLGPADEAQALG
jgi:hypothetical protein